ncbi:MAG: 1-acyl-sn-glycerol-3-phosphate acyltransferase [Bacteroidota bacterium]
MRVEGRKHFIHIMFPHVVFFVRRFFRQHKIIGFDKIPENEPVIIAPNHQNAFMDAILMTGPSGWHHQLSFLVRASIFQSKMSNYMLRRLNMLPVYRKDVDGTENMGKNDEIFDNCIWLLSNKKRLVLFPEGTHNIRRKLLPLKKGLTRIAFAAEEQNNFSLNLKIFPVGITYEDAKNFNRNVLLQVGDPILLADYYETYKTNPGRAHALIKNELEKRIKELMIHIPSDNFNEMTEGLRIIDASEKNITDNLEEFKNSKILIGKTEKYISGNQEQATVLKDEVKEYFSIIGKNDFRDHLFTQRETKMNPLTVFLLILLSPVFLFGAIHNALPFFLPKRLAEKLIKDPGFVSSIKASAAMVFFPVFRLICCILFFIFSGSFWLTLCYYFSIVISGEVAFWCLKKWKKFFVLKRFEKFKGTEDYNKAMFYRKKIVNTLNTL